MPAASWRMYPARTRNLWLATSASAGASRKVGINSADQRCIVSDSCSWRIGYCSSRFEDARSTEALARERREREDAGTTAVFTQIDCGMDSVYFFVRSARICLP